MTAAFAFGPNTFRPASSNASTTPAIKGTSGPTIVKPMLLSLQNELTPHDRPRRLGQASQHLSFHHCRVRQILG